MSKANDLLEKLNEGFMKPEVFKSKGLEIDTFNDGSIFLPDDVIDSEKLFKGRSLEKGAVAGVWDKIKGYLEGIYSYRSIYAIRKIDGWFGRLSASGYLDSTDYTFGNSEKAVRDQLSDMYGDDDDE